MTKKLEASEKVLALKQLSAKAENLKRIADELLEIEEAILGAENTLDCTPQLRIYNMNFSKKNSDTVCINISREDMLNYLKEQKRIKLRTLTDIHLEVQLPKVFTEEERP